MIAYRLILTAVSIVALSAAQAGSAAAQQAGSANAAPSQAADGGKPRKAPAPAKPAVSATNPEKIAKPEAPGAVNPAAAKPAASKPAARRAAASADPASSSPPAQAEKSEKPPAPKLTVSSWGGGYGQAQNRAIIVPFAKAANIKVIQLRHGGAGKEIETKADVVDVSAATLAAACKSGDLLALDDLDLAPSPRGLAASDDFLKGGRTKCGIASMAWSHVVLFDKKAFKRRAPKRLKDVFNIRRFPGKRAFVKRPRYLLEMALMADGVKPGKVYALLDTYKGVKRALAKLATLWGKIVWLETPGDAYEALTSGRVAIAAGFSARAFRTVMANPQTAVIWDGQIYDVDYWAIPKTTRNVAAARRFVRFATAPERLAANARHFPYGPMRKSAVAMTGRHAMLDIDLAPHLPTSPKNLRNALQLNTSWWAENGSMMMARFEIWQEMESAKRAKSRTSRRRRKRSRRRSR